MSKKKKRKQYPLRVAHTAYGFRTQELRTLSKTAWWVRRWILAIDMMRLGGRGGRGKTYAERGQVLSLNVTGGHVTAQVMGARSKPYDVTLDFRPVVLPEKPDEMDYARTLAGEMPAAAFDQSGLFPKIGHDHFFCSCPDWGRPCKHVAAVLYMLADAMVRDPSLLLRLRGLWPYADETPYAAPVWKGTARFEEFITRMHKKVEF